MIHPRSTVELTFSPVAQEVRMIDEPTTMSSGVEVLLNVRYQAISAAPQSVWFLPTGAYAMPATRRANFAAASFIAMLSAARRSSSQ